MTSKTRDIILWIVVNMCRLLVSGTFVFSGMVKLIDPTGTQYKIEDYFTALGLATSADSLLPIVLAVVLALLELCLGVYLFFGIRRRVTTHFLLAFMILYSPLTLWLAISNAVADCGCFGDAVKLTNWQTFWKNAALLVMTTIVWWRGNLLTRFISESAQWIISLYTILYGLFIAAIGLYLEPVMDFRPFHIGQHIPSAMAWPEDPSEQPEILDFDIEGEITADELLTDTSYVFLLISPYLEKADDSDFERINSTYDYARRHGYRFLSLTASSPEVIRRWQDLTGAEYPFAFMDELTLKTIARRNPALVLLHGGTIVAKWPAAVIPDEAELQAPLHALPLAHPQKENYQRSLLSLALWYILPIITLTLIDRFIFSLRWWRRRHQTAKNT
ncbi:MAG: DoxX family membrane protein [Bacteroidaceae bacterium]|nr:DoxX family membrane protein [Bacteroidaceae bacterium]